MFETIRSRLIAIAVLVIVAIWSLWPREVSIRKQGDDGRMFDTVETRWPIKLGLDLQGGIHLALEIDESRGAVPNRADALRRALTVVRQRTDEFGVAEPLVQQVGDDRIVVEVPGERDPQRAKDIVQRSAFLEFRITDMQGQFGDALPAIDAALRRAGVTVAPTAGGAAPVASAVEQLLGADTTADTTAADAGVGGGLSQYLFQGGVPGEYLVPEEAQPTVDSLLRLPMVQREMPRGYEVLWGREAVSQGGRSFAPMYVVERRPIITGEQLADASASIDQLYNQPIVQFQMTRNGGRVFARETGQHINDHMAVVLDGRVQGQPPIIQSQINRNGQITMGNSSLQQAQDLALVLRAGALPAPLIIVEERTVGPSLGDDSIRKGITAALVGAILVVLTVAAYYRFAGLRAVGALGLYGLLTLAGLAMFGATLTLPGLAGFILSIGMAVDANVLIFERIREELKLGKTTRVGVDAGFQHAMPAIIDSNLTTVLTALFLFQFGTGPVKGFAITLIVGIMASFISAVFITRTFFLIWLDRRAPQKELSI